MLEMCDLLLEHAADDRKFSAAAVTQAAAQRWIEIIGEAASHVSDGLKLANPDVSWREIVGVRLILAHGYFHIDDDIISTVVSHDIPRLRSHLRAASRLASRIAGRLSFRTCAFNSASVHLHRRWNRERVPGGGRNARPSSLVGVGLTEPIETRPGVRSGQPVLRWHADCRLRRPRLPRRRHDG
jgi:uncharacterized protein with HEPN domain